MNKFSMWPILHSFTHTQIVMTPESIVEGVGPFISRNQRKGIYKERVN